MVDDEPGARLLCRTILEREGFRVQEAETGREALDALAGGRSVDLVLADVVMPGMHDVISCEPSGRIPSSPTSP